MSTNGSVLFSRRHKDGECRNLVQVYRHCDGYVEGLGYELAEWLLKKKMINGISFNQSMKEYANGLGCLAAEFIHDFKTDLGDVYICETGDRDFPYLYHVVIDDDVNGATPVDNICMITVYDWNGKVIFFGKPSELIKFKEPES